MITTLTGQIGKLLKDIQDRREAVKEEYCKAWLAATIPDKNLNIDYLIQNVELVEKWSEDGMKVSWYLEMKKEPSDDRTREDPSQRP